MQQDERATREGRDVDNSCVGLDSNGCERWSLPIRPEEILNLIDGERSLRQHYGALVATRKPWESDPVLANSQVVCEGIARFVIEELRC